MIYSLFTFDAIFVSCDLLTGQVDLLHFSFLFSVGMTVDFLVLLLPAALLEKNSRMLDPVYNFPSIGKGEFNCDQIQTPFIKLRVLHLCLQLVGKQINHEEKLSFAC